MCENCNWEDLVGDLDELLDEERYEFAGDTLEGIREWVVKNEHCTEAQKQAVQNIKNSVGF